MTIPRQFWFKNSQIFFLFIRSGLINSFGHLNATPTIYLKIILKILCFNKYFSKTCYNFFFFLKSLHKDKVEPVSHPLSNLMPQKHQDSGEVKMTRINGTTIGPLTHPSTAHQWERSYSFQTLDDENQQNVWLENEPTPCTTSPFQIKR